MRERRLRRLRELKGVCKTNSIEVNVVVGLDYIVIYGLDIYISDVISEQDDFITMYLTEILALHVLRLDKAGLEKSSNESA